MNHCMIDLETLGTQPGSIILSIGAVLFDPTKAPTECLGEEFYYVIGKPTCLAAGLTFSQDTLDWWKKQSPEARKVLTQSEDPNESISLTKALERFSLWLPPNTKVWSNGANFDQPLLDVAYNKIGKVIPWKYYHSRCYRTILGLHANEKNLRPATILAHNALEDAKWQARHMVNVVQALNLKLQ